MFYSHRNVSVRKTAAHFLSVVVERMGPGRVLSGVKDVTDRILPIAAQFVVDGSPETRYYGQKIFYTLMSHEDFERMLNKYVSASTLRNINDKLETLKKRVSLSRNDRKLGTNSQYLKLNTH